MGIDNTYLCQKCGEIKDGERSHPSWRTITLPDGRSFSGNVCPECDPAFLAEEKMKRDARFFQVKLRVKVVEVLKDGTIIAETADEFDRGTRIHLAPDQMRENA